MLVDMYTRYKAEEKKWVNAGRPMRTKEEMSNIYEICSECPMFEKDKSWCPGYDRCGICKCNLHPTRTLLNKLAWSTTECPAETPRWRPSKDL